MTGRYKVMAVNDDKDFCQCCGRQGLMRVVWIEDAETQEVKHFGTTCAASPVKGFGVDAEIKKAIRDFKDREGATYRYAYSLYRKAGGALEGNGNDGWTFADKELHAKCVSQAREHYK